MENRIEGQIQKNDWPNKIHKKLSKVSKGISYSLLGCLALAFIVGVVATLIFQNVTKSETVTFSTISLVSFLFSVALVGASIVLAVTAIGISKASEQAMIDRSDESIRLQNEIFMKTTDALQRIESSTGVTEKRVEDIISGRAGDISQRIAEQAVGGKLIPLRSRSRLEEEAKKSIVDELSEAKRKERKRAGLRQTEDKFKARTSHEKFNADVLLGLANEKKVKSEKIGEGIYGRKKEELVDGVFVIDGKKFAVSTFSQKEILQYLFLTGFSRFINDVSLEIDSGAFERAFFVFDGKLKDDNEYNKQFTQAKKLMRKDLCDKLFIISGSIEEINQQILSTFKSENTN